MPVPADPRFPPPLPPKSAARLRTKLLRWYGAHRRDLPWRRDRDAYRVWISEAMLQQTRVEAVVGYYERFLARFPDVAALAAASEAEVLSAWSGLGYYRRASALREAARAIVERHGGVFPEDREALLNLPGIGPYTAGAVLSIAFDRPEPLVDGNVARVFCRLFELDAEHAAPALQRELWSRAAALVPRRGGAGDWNQALMELGATICVPRAPRCERCPVAAECAARASGRAAELPRPKRRRTPDEVELELLVVVRRGRWLLERRPAGGRMAGLLELPTVELPSRADGRVLLFSDRWPEPIREHVALGEALGDLRHTITHHRIRASIRRGELGRGARASAWKQPLCWVPEAELADAPLTGMARKVVRRFQRV